MTQAFNRDCMEAMKEFPDKFFDIIVTDPPYKYLDHKLDVDFDEFSFFNQSERILNDNGFIILFGRGSSFYRWNTTLDNMGFKFLEEIVWNKRRPTSAALPLARVHETISIHTKGSGKIQESIINYGEIKAYDVDKIYEDIKRLGGLFNKGKAFEKVVQNLKKIDLGEDYSHGYKKDRHKITFSSPTINRCVSTYTINALENGVREQSIITDSDVHYGNIHPTQKPVRLIQRLISLVADENTKNIVDPFLGSGSSRIAAHDMGFQFWGYELDKDYFEAQEKRFKQHIAQLTLFTP